jgi:DNA polymerase-1
MATIKKVLIFDGTNTFHRNFVVNPTADGNGQPIGGLLGTLKTLKWMIKEIKPTQVIFVWDGEGGSKKRRGIVSQYKMGRKPRLNRGEVDETLVDSRANYGWQKQKLTTLLGFLGVTQIEVDDIEADDTIGYLVGLLDPAAKVLVSSDRDMWQLISDTTIVYWPPKKTYISRGTFQEQTPVLPENYVLFRALSGKGDVSDNIHGITGLGEKTIMKLLPELATKPCTFMDVLEMCERMVKEHGAALKGKFRWYQTIIESKELVSTNIEVMQLTTPIISAQSSGIIRAAAALKPSFNVTGFKLALLNNGIQLTDIDFFATFQEYRQRTSNEAA